jgi:hypothetical protein
LAVIQKSLAAAKAMPRLAGVLRGASAAFPDIPDRPGLPRHVEGDGTAVTGELTEGFPERDFVPPARTSPVLPDLSPEEQALLVRTGNRKEFPGALPKDLADQELAIVKRAEKIPITGGDGKYVNEVDLGNGHRWKERPNRTWCRFSNGGTNCTVLVQEPSPQLPGTVVAFATTKSGLRDIYFGWAEHRANDNVEVALLRSRGTPDYPEGTYVVVVGGADRFVYPGDRSEPWIMVAHSHPGASRQPGYANPSGADMQLTMRGALGRTTRRIRKWIHSQAPDGTWREVEYGLDLEREQFYVQPTGGNPEFFNEIIPEDLPRDAIRRYRELEEAGMERVRIDLMIEQMGIEYYLGWYARQFSPDR